MPSVRDLAVALESWAPPGSKLSYDAVGLQVGDPTRSVASVLVALDLTPAVVGEAEAMGADLIVTHHPLLFKPLKRLVPTDFVSGLAYRLAQSGIAYYAIHTNLDAAPGGVSFALAEHLGLEEVRFLDGMRESLAKLVTFVPASHADAVRAALAKAGAGQIGDYSACAFTTEGTGHFRPGDSTDPFVGTPGKLESADEVRLEVEVARWDVARVVRALRQAHPYEEVAYDIYHTERPSTRAGLGAVGTLAEPEPLHDFLRRVAERLDAGSLRYVGNDDALVETVAVCGGSGSSLISHALAAGADAFITADVTYHTFFEPLAPDGAPRLALIDAGHYETEWVTERLLADWLAARFDGLTVRATTQRTSPMQTFVAP
ncbi:MAG: Nif3-like dinuclear metal center hexameric protein [Rhodothermales bacterium]